MHVIIAMIVWVFYLIKMGNSVILTILKLPFMELAKLIPINAIINIQHKILEISEWLVNFLWNIIEVKRI